MITETVPFFMIVVDYDFLGRDSKTFLRKVEELSELPARGDICVQLRVRNEDSARSCALAKQGSEVFSNEIVPLFWNGKTEIAREFGYAGCHHPEADLANVMTIEDGLIHSASVHNLATLKRAELLGVRFVVFGAVFKPTWKAVNPQGLKALREITDLSRVPVLAIGGIQHDNLASLRSFGAHGFACLSTVIGSNSPVKEARRFINKWEENAL